MSIIETLQRLWAMAPVKMGVALIVLIAIFNIWLIAPLYVSATRAFFVRNQAILVVYMVVGAALSVYVCDVLSDGLFFEQERARYSSTALTPQPAPSTRPNRTRCADAR
jgi:hypothetical protein